MGWIETGLQRIRAEAGSIPHLSLKTNLSNDDQVRLRMISIKADDAVYWKRTWFGGKIAKKYLPIGVVKTATEVRGLALAV